MHKLFDLYSQEEGHQQQAPSYILHDLTQPLSVGTNTSAIPQDDFIEAYQDFYKKVIREHVKEETEEEIKQRRQENRVYFDFTKPLEEEPQYLKEIQELSQMQQPRKRKKNLINEISLKHIYTPATAFKQFQNQPDIEKAP